MENKIVIVGRPNVGKSSLFNRLVGMGKSLVRKGGMTTRDRIEGTFTFKGRLFKVVDTGGVPPDTKDILLQKVHQQIKQALKEADFLLFVVDVQEGLVPQDLEVAIELRREKKPVLVIANKSDNDRLSENAVDFYPLGFGTPFPISCVQGKGFIDLREYLYTQLKEETQEKVSSPIRVAVVGRPNVGKSSFLNALLHDERLIVTAAPGTTRDPVDIPFTSGERDFILIDTAGIRRLSRIRDDEILYRCVRTSQEMIRRSDVCLVLIDGSVGIQRDDLRVLQRVIEEGRGLVLVVNKWDLVPEFSQTEAESILRRRLGSIRFIPILFTSALTGKNIFKALELAEHVFKDHTASLETHALNEFLQGIRRRRHLLPGRVMPSVRYVVQVATRPPKFLLFGSEKNVSESFLRYFEKGLREKFSLFGTPVRFEIREDREEKKKK